MIHGFASSLLWRHIGNRPHRLGLFGDHRFSDDLGETKVHDRCQALFIDQDIGALDITMDDSPVLSFRQALAA